MSLTFTKSTSSSLSNSNRVNSFKSKNKGDFASKKAVTVSKSQFNPQCPVVILKRPCSDSKASINIICVDSENKSIINTSQSFSNKLNTLETKRKSAPKSQTSKSPNLSSSVNISKTKSSPKGKLALGAQPLSEARSSNKTRPHVRGKPRRNSVSAHNVSNFNSGLEDQVYSPGSLSDDPFNSVSPSAPLNSIKESSMYNPEYYTVLFNQDKKNQEALSLLESLLSKSLFDLSLTDKLKGPHDLSSTHENKKKAMASHLLINLLKPSPGSPNMNNNQGPKRFYAGPQFKQAPNISSLPFPATMINRA